MANCAFYLEDTVGDTFLYTVAADTYERSFREHANWWKCHIRGQRLTHDGKPIRKPAFPVHVVVKNLDSEHEERRAA